MVNFMCQLDWSMGCPDIGSNIILRLLGRVLLDEMNILIHRLSKADCLPKGSWSSCNWLKSWIEQKGTSSDWLDWNMRLKTDTRFSWVSRLQGLRWKLTPSVFLGLQLADCRSQDSFQFSSVQFSSVQFSSVAQSCPTLCDPMNRSTPDLLSITNSRSLLRPMSIESVMPSSHLILCRPLLLLPPIPPSIRVFSNESALCMRWPSTGVSASASVLPVNTQGWSPLGWTGWIALQSKGLSRVFSNTTVQKRQFFSSHLSLWSNSHIHTWLLEKPQPWLLRLHNHVNQFLMINIFLCLYTSYWPWFSGEP